MSCKRLQLSVVERDEREVCSVSQQLGSAEGGSAAGALGAPRLFKYRVDGLASDYSLSSSSRSSSSCQSW